MLQLTHLLTQLMRIHIRSTWMHACTYIAMHFAIQVKLLNSNLQLAMPACIFFNYKAILLSTHLFTDLCYVQLANSKLWR